MHPSLQISSHLSPSPTALDGRDHVVGAEDVTCPGTLDGLVVAPKVGAVAVEPLRPSEEALAGLQGGQGGGGGWRGSGC